MSRSTCRRRLPARRSRSRRRCPSRLLGRSGRVRCQEATRCSRSTSRRTAGSGTSSSPDRPRSPKPPATRPEPAADQEDDRVHQGVLCRHAQPVTQSHSASLAAQAAAAPAVQQKPARGGPTSEGERLATLALAGVVAVAELWLAQVAFLGFFGTHDIWTLQPPQRAPRQRSSRGRSRLDPRPGMSRPSPSAPVFGLSHRGQRSS